MQPQSLPKEQIEFTEFLEIEKKLDIRIGMIVDAERIPKTDKLLKLQVIFGPEAEDVKTVVTNLGEQFEPDFFKGLKCPFIMNLKPVIMKGVESQAMIMVGTLRSGTVVPEMNEYETGTTLL
jgi:tRNA-binding EMAP/Myf-like protein